MIPTGRSLTAVRERVEVEIKYAGYIKKQLAQVEQMRRLERKELPPDVDYKTIAGLRAGGPGEAQQDRPLNLGRPPGFQGSTRRIHRVLLIWLSQRNGRGEEETHD